MDILIILTLVLLNGVFSMSELALVSAKRVRLEKQAAAGSGAAKVALQLAEQPSRFLSTVQVGITLIGIFNGAFGEASLTAKLTPHVAAIPTLAPHAQDVSFGIVVACITFVSIVLGELVPKRIAIQYPEFMATAIAVPLDLLSRLMTPFVKLLSVATDFIARLLGVRDHNDTVLTEDDIAGMIRESTDAGVFEKTESDIAARALRLDDQRIRSIMTPRVDLAYIDLNDKVEDNLIKIANAPYSRFPVCRGDRSQILGVVHAIDLFEQAIRHASLSGIDIGAAVKPVLHVPETISGMTLLEQFKQHRTELAVIVDEYGDIEGIVTLSDVMGVLVGDVPTIGDDQPADAIRRPDGSWLMDGSVSVHRFRELLGTDAAFPNEEAGIYHTLAGFMLDQLGRIPEPAASVEWKGYRFEVVDMDGHRIDRLLVSRAATPAGPAAGED